MSRELKRVPLDFAWPLKTVWKGYLLPESLHEQECSACDGSGWSPRGKQLHDQWYGNAPFRPEDNGSTPLTPLTPAVWAFAERNVTRSPEYYGTAHGAIHWEALRLSNLWNECWSHHLNQDDVDALVESGRMREFTHTRNSDGRGWVEIVPSPYITPEQVNDWSITGMGHDSINALIAIRARCEREGVPSSCETCAGHGTTEKYPGQRAEAEVWEPLEPPTGEGYQAWETTSEGSPISPVFAAAAELVEWAVGLDSGLAFGGGPVSREAAEAFVREGSSFCSLVSTPETGLIDGVEALTLQSSDPDSV